MKNASKIAKYSEMQRKKALLQGFIFVIFHMLFYHYVTSLTDLFPFFCLFFAVFRILFVM